MDRASYNACMKPYMSGGGEDRKRRFCIGAKICSGKASDEKGADRICAEAAINPKPRKTKKEPAKQTYKVCTLGDLKVISTCLSEKIDLSKLTPDNMQQVFNDALEKCSTVKTAKRITAAQVAIAQLDPEQIKALETIALLSKQAEGRIW